MVGFIEFVEKMRDAEIDDLHNLLRVDQQIARSEFWVIEKLAR